MAANRPGWIERVREVGLAFADLARAELGALADELGKSGAALARALLLAAIAAGVLFWSLGLLVYFAVELLALALPRWGAVGIVFGLFSICGALLVFGVRRKLSRIEPPAETVKRRLADTRTWWETRIAEPDEPALPAESQRRRDEE
jgi:uncharacterized membrane protein YbhN (UPF0104 family)